MKNLFLVINKEKIYAYVVSIMTDVVIFFMSSIINSDLDNTEVTSSNSIESNVIQTNNSTEVNENKESASDGIVENAENVESSETNGKIGEAVSTSTPSETNDNENSNNITE